MGNFIADKKATYRQIGDKNSSQLLFREEKETQGKGKEEKMREVKRRGKKG